MEGSESARIYPDDGARTIVSRLSRHGMCGGDLRTTKWMPAWEQRKLGEVCVFDKGSGYSKADIANEGTPLILYGRLYTQYEALIKSVDTFADPKEGSRYSHGDEVVVPASGETADDIAVAAHIASSGMLIGGDLNIVTPCDCLDPTFLALGITHASAHYQLARKAQGKSVVHIHNEDIADVDFGYPSLPEQRQITNVILSLDSLITLHQRECGPVIGGCLRRKAQNH